MTIQRFRSFCLLATACVLLNACGSPKPKSTTSNTPTRAGNAPFYTVMGERYTILPNNQGYKERGVASWYGKKFHGRPTANGETFDMHELTAAHKSLVLPTCALVTNLRNNKSVWVRVNDRGPFVNNRLIDLSYAAANELDMVQDGTTLVEVQAMDCDTPKSARTSNTRVEIPAKLNQSDAHTLFIQIGAFSEHENAMRLLQRMQQLGFRQTTIHSSTGNNALHRVRLGPINDVDDYDTLVQQLSLHDIHQHHIVRQF